MARTPQNTGAGHILIPPAARSAAGDTRWAVPA
ncbi:MAG: hypothetical protein QOC64_3009 [Solirubrobacteraceae bacterium]|nr:hypothetical protein [Solirubrobacteraceae bacterium]